MLLWKRVLHGLLHHDDVKDDERKGGVAMSDVLELVAIVAFFGNYIWVMFKIGSH